MTQPSVVARESQHTPLPWVRSNQGFSVFSTLPNYPDCADALVCVTAHNAKGRTPESQANAEFIVRACNSHQALVEALQAILDCGSIKRAEQLAEQALRLAQGEK